MGYEQTITRRTKICSDKHCDIIKEELVFITCGRNTLLSQEMPSDYGFFDHEQFKELINTVQGIVETTPREDEDTYYEYRSFLRDLMKIEKETNWEKSELFYAAG